MADGVAKGRAEERKAMAKELKKQGVPLSIIKQVTSLSPKEWEEL